MTDDIVKYLRLSQTRFNRHAEAADEIERLRTEVEHLLHLWKVLMATVKAEEFANGKWIRGEIGAEELNLVATDRANAFNAFDMAVRGQ